MSAGQQYGEKVILEHLVCPVVSKLSFFLVYFKVFFYEQELQLAFIITKLVSGQSWGQLYDCI